ncbi:MAG TPA: carbohydrate ABC transporter permease [Thermomicrobiales bacterium]|jgi:raffinose/stachyose/melibiose transport system permease protein|nr:carbohydrate ABC transporter permease [Thermomicrobiales bacterium]
MARLSLVTRHTVLIVLALLALFPIGFLLINSVKTELAYSRDPLALPETFEWHHYSEAFDLIVRPILNSVVIVAISVLGIVTFAAMSAYAFTFMSFPLRRLLFALVFVLLLIPGVLTLIPLYLQIKRLDIFGLSNSWGGLILPYIAAGQAFSIFVLRTFFGGISKDLIDAARVDGASEWHIFGKIVVPLSVPVLVSVIVVNIVPLWNDYLLPSLLLSEKYRTLTIALVSLQGNALSHSSSQFGTLMAAYVIACVPLAIVFAFLMRYYVQGLTSGALKL